MTILDTKINPKTIVRATHEKTELFTVN